LAIFKDKYDKTWSTIRYKRGEDDFLDAHDESERWGLMLRGDSEDYLDVSSVKLCTNLTEESEDEVARIHQTSAEVSMVASSPEHCLPKPPCCRCKCDGTKTPELNIFQDLHQNATPTSSLLEREIKVNPFVIVGNPTEDTKIVETKITLDSPLDGSGDVDSSNEKEVLISLD